jgi:two-component system, response regulator PdtaR
MHALIIEDEPMIALLIEDHLRAIGYTTVDFAVTEAEAVAAAGKRCPDLITSDVRLGDGCGIAAVETICSGQRVPVVFITSVGCEVHQRMSDAVVLSKPFAPAQLDRVLIGAVSAGQPSPKVQPGERVGK